MMLILKIKLTFNKIKYLRTFLSLDPIAHEIMLENIVVNKIKSNQEITIKHFNPRLGILINARMNSTRLKGKALKKINGYPSLEILINRMKKVKGVNEIVLCTTHEKRG